MVEIPDWCDEVKVHVDDLFPVVVVAAAAAAAADLMNWSSFLHKDDDQNLKREELVFDYAVDSLLLMLNEGEK